MISEQNASTTLVTFSVTIPRPSATFVQLLGSWDNFTKPYNLAKDAKISKTEWRLCPRFTDIVCDGQRLEAKPRDGGLQMGSRYWYFYRIDDEEEFVNTAQPTTRACPFLPGQEVNVLEVPKLLQRRASDASLSTEYTLDPRDKYAPLKSEEGVVSMLHHSTASPDDSQSSVPRQSQISAKQRSLLSAGSLSSLKLQVNGKNHHPPWKHANVPANEYLGVLRPSKQSPGGSVSIATKRPETQPSTAHHFRWSASTYRRRPWSASGALHPRLQHSMQRAIVSGSTVSSALSCPSRTGNSGRAGLESLDGEAGIQRANIGDNRDLLPDNGGRKSQNCLSSLLHLTLPLEENLDFGIESSCDYFSDTFEQRLGRPSQAEEAASPCTDHFAALSERLTDWSSRYNGQACSTSNDTSAVQSQPMTPMQNDFDAGLPRLTSRSSGLASQSHDMYSLRTAERASALTLHTLRALPDDSATTPTKATFKGTNATNRRVEEWVDRSESTMEELCKDMGYLSSWID